MNFCSKFLCWTSHFTVFTIKEVQFTLFLYGLCFYLVNFQKFMHYLLCKSSPLSRRNCEKEFILRLDCRISSERVTYNARFYEFLLFLNFRHIIWKTKGILKIMHCVCPALRHKLRPTACIYFRQNSPLQSCKNLRKFKK